MEILVPIPEATYLTARLEYLTGRNTSTLYECVAKATVIPSHGRLIDADALDLDREVTTADDWKTAHEIANCVKYAPTVIAASQTDHWVHTQEILNDRTFYITKCSKCLTRVHEETEYCPYCGAHMVDIGSED